MLACHEMFNNYSEAQYVLFDRYQVFSHKLTSIQMEC